jgi:CubicO group peptidase (beta-lactamase class C family)
LLKRTLGVFLGCIVILPLNATAVAQTAADDPVDDYIHAQMEKGKIPGIALLVMKDGQIERAKGYGFSNVELQVPVKPETIFQSGSMGKQFTAMAVMMLAEQGKLSIDDPLTKFFPDAPATW